MSQRVKVTTEMREERFLEEALEELNVSFSKKEDSYVINDGCSYQETRIEKNGDKYQISGESYKVKDLKKNLITTYGKLVALDEVRISGHSVVSEEVLSDGTIKILVSA